MRRVHGMLSGIERGVNFQIFIFIVCGNMLNTSATKSCADSFSTTGTTLQTSNEIITYCSCVYL